MIKFFKGLLISYLMEELIISAYDITHLVNLPEWSFSIEYRKAWYADKKGWFVKGGHDYYLDEDNTFFSKKQAKVFDTPEEALVAFKMSSTYIKYKK